MAQTFEQERQLKEAGATAPVARDSAEAPSSFRDVHGNLVSSEDPPVSEPLPTRELSDTPVTDAARGPVDAQVADQARWWAGVAKNEAVLVAQDIARSTSEVPRNVLATLLGGASDLTQMIASIPIDPRTFRDATGTVMTNEFFTDEVVDAMQAKQATFAEGIPFTSDKLVDAMGGDSTSVGFRIAQFIPTSGKDLVDIGVGGAVALKKALFLGPIAVGRIGGPKVTRLKEFLKLDSPDLPPFNRELHQQTGFYRDIDGGVKFHLSDVDSFVKHKFVINHQGLRAASKQAAQTGQSTNVVLMGRLDELLGHPDLYEIFPEVAGMRLRVHIEALPDGSIRMINVKDPLTQGAVVRRGNTVLHLETGTIDGIEDLHHVLLHEAQHTIDRIEGFATGTVAFKAQRVGELTQAVADSALMNRAMKLVKEGNVFPDDLHRALVAEGISTEIADNIVKHEIINLYTTAITQNATDVMATLERVSATALNDAQRDAVHILNYLGLNGLEDDAAKLVQGLTEGLRFEDLNDLGLQAYLHSAGEANARLGPALKDFTQVQLDRMGPFDASDPALQRSLELPVTDPARMSIGPREVPGTADIQQSLRSRSAFQIVEE